MAEEEKLKNDQELAPVGRPVSFPAPNGRPTGGSVGPAKGGYCCREGRSSREEEILGLR